MSYLFGLVRRLWHDEEAATVVEYALLIGLIAIGCVVAITSLGHSLAVPFQHTINGLS